MNSSKKLRVFLIEDAPKLRSILIDILQETGQIEVIGYADAEKDALHQLRSKEWDVAIVDIGLRDGNGLRVLEGLNRDARVYGERLVFTSHASEALRARTIDLGATGFFDKSRDLNALLTRIMAIANWRANDQHIH